MSFYISVLCDDHPYIVLSETWLTQDIKNSELFPTVYQVSRCDRDYTSECQRGGCVLIAVKNSATVSPIDLTSLRQNISRIIDIVACKVKCNTKKRLHIIAVYIPPKISLQDFEEFLES